MKRVVQAEKFKAECLRFMEEVKSKGVEFIITKGNIPIAKLSPIEKQDTTLFGKMKGTVHVKSDLIAPIEEEWDANH